MLLNILVLIAIPSVIFLACALIARQILISFLQSLLPDKNEQSNEGIYIDNSININNSFNNIANSPKSKFEICQHCQATKLIGSRCKSCGSN